VNSIAVAKLSYTSHSSTTWVQIIASSADLTIMK